MDLQTLQSLPPLPLFSSMFILIYFISYFIIFGNWSPQTRAEASSCLISLFHGTPAAFLAFTTTTISTFSFSSPNTIPQNNTLDFSISYFLADLIHYLIFFPKDILFIAHHLATLFVFISCRYIVYHGASAVLGLLFLAEVTSACQNVWTLAGLRRKEVTLAAKVYELLSFPFFTFYSVVRGVLGPLFMIKMVAFYVGGGADGVIPRWVWVSWVVVVVTAIGVSILWIWNLWVELFRERKAKSEEEKKVR